MKLWHSYPTSRSRTENEIEIIAHGPTLVLEPVQ